jgi:hypothetical protein
MLEEVGTLEWARRTNGILGSGERARFIARVVFKTSVAGPRLMAMRAGVRGGGIDPSELTPPDTPAMHAVVDACADLGPAVVEHSYRSYLYGRALAQVEGVEVDEEELFAGAMFHDYGFPQMETLTDRCFTLVGADGALEVLGGQGWDQPRCETVAESVTRHLNPEVPLEQGAVQHFVHDGVILDVVGLRAWELDADGIERVRERHPRHGFNRIAGTSLKGHGKRVPGCRAAALYAAGFGFGLKLSPWND